MSLYRKKPVVVEAMRLTSDNAEAVYDFSNGRVYRSAAWGQDVISTSEGAMRVNIGDWVIQGTQGEFYPCKDSVFQEVYEPVDEQGTS